MITPLQEPLLIGNQDADFSFEEFKKILLEKSIEYEIQIKEAKKAFTDSYKGGIEIKFLYKIYFVEIPDLSIDEEGIQKVKYTEIITKFNLEGKLKIQSIHIDNLVGGEQISAAYEIIEPFLNSDEWELVKRKPNNIYGTFRRCDDILLQNTDKRLLALYRYGRVVIFEPLELLELRKKNF